MVQTIFVVVFLPSDIYKGPVLIQLTVFTMSVHVGFIPKSLYFELASACTVKIWCFCRFSERFLGFVYNNYMVTCWESTGAIKSARSKKVLQKMTKKLCW